MVENMREAYSLFGTTGTATVINAEAWNNETGFEPGTGDMILNSWASATNGPVLYMRQNNINDVVAQIELSGDQPQPGRDWDIAYISGNRNNIALTKGDVTPGVLSSNSLIRLSQNYNDWRHLPGLQDAPIADVNRNTRDLSIMNTTGQDMMLGTPSMINGINYTVTNGNVLGGSGTVFTYQQGSSVNIIINAGGKLDPVGTFGFNVGAGDLELIPGINSANSQALLFHLETPTTSDQVAIAPASRLNIGTAVLNFDDFVFTTSEAFAGGTFTLFESTQAVAGTLGTNLAGEIDGLAATLMLGPGNTTILLDVELAVTALAGDYNDDGVVDAADYTVWRDLLGSLTSLPNETESPGIVDEQDYLAWQDNFGASSGTGGFAAGGAATVPEPDALAVTLVSVFVRFVVRRRNRLAA